MICVSLVGTFHDEKGLATVSELHKILTHLRPQVIFLEVPPTALEGYLNAHGHRTLESKAVELYQEQNTVELIPVDLPTPDLNFFENGKYLHNRIEQASPDFCRLSDWNSNYVRQYGFAYLNSKYCTKMWSDLDQEMAATVARLDEPRLFELHETWTQMIDRRDVEMLKNILKYARSTNFERGAFLVGASHRRSIIKKSRGGNVASLTNIQWNYLDAIEQEDSPSSA